MIQEAVVVVLIYCLVGTHLLPLLLKTKKHQKNPDTALFGLYCQPGEEGRGAKKGKSWSFKKHTFSINTNAMRPINLAGGGTIRQRNNTLQL